MSLFYNKTLISTEKKGFAVPIDSWLKNELKKDVMSTIFETKFYGNNLLNFEAIKNYVNDFYNNKHNEAWGIWHIYAWQKWAINEGLI